MARWQNFSIWRGRLPHWRADDVTYYVTFRHRRPLTFDERRTLFLELLRHQGKRLDWQILAVRPEITEGLMSVLNDDRDLGDYLEKSKSKAGKVIIKESGERFPPFFHESYDRIVRDQEELAETWQRLLDEALNQAEADEDEDGQCLWVVDAPQG